MALNVIYKNRTGTTAEWAASTYILLKGEMGVDTDLNICKIGDGINTWGNLPVINNTEYMSLAGDNYTKNQINGDKAFTGMFASTSGYFEVGEMVYDESINAWKGTAVSLTTAIDTPLTITGYYNTGTAYGENGEYIFPKKSGTVALTSDLTASNVGLGNVVNTGDSATPVSGGTTKFTTGGAYILRTAINDNTDNIKALDNALGTKQDALTEAQLNAVNSGITSADKTTLDNVAGTYVKKSGDTMTGTLSTPSLNTTGESSNRIIATGTNGNSYFQSRKLRNEGDTGCYRHAIDFGYSGNNQFDFYEYGGTFNFWKNEPVAKNTNDTTRVVSLQLGKLVERGNTLTYPGKSGTIAVKEDFATVATSGSYNDLTDKPDSYFLPAATTNVLGGIKVGYTTTDKNYKVQLDDSSNAYVNVPWTDTNTSHSHTAGTGLSVSGSGGISGTTTYSLKTASSSEIGGVKSSTTGTTADRDYAVEVNADGTMKVNVPWTGVSTDKFVTTDITDQMVSGKKTFSNLQLYENTADSTYRITGLAAAGTTKTWKMPSYEGTLIAACNNAGSSFISSPILSIPQTLAISRAGASSSYSATILNEGYITLRDLTRNNYEGSTNIKVAEVDSSDDIDIVLPSESGTLALTSAIPSTDRFVDTSSLQYITGEKRFGAITFNSCTADGGSIEFIAGTDTIELVTSTRGSGEGTTYTLTLPKKTGTLATTADVAPTITLNGSVTTTPTFYAPTSAGTNGYYLRSSGSGAPYWSTGPSVPTKTSKTFSATSTYWKTSSATTDTAFGKYYMDTTVPSTDILSVRVTSNYNNNSISTSTYYPEVICENRKTSATNLRIYSNVMMAGLVKILSM